MTALFYLFIFIFGLIIGSFISAFTYRFPRGEKISSGRSRCPKCKKIISWYDNVPLLSYLLLSGKCRNCGKKISSRYPLIEIATAALFIVTFKGLSLQGAYSIWLIVYWLLLTSLLIAVFVIDYEHQIIPDELIFTLFFLALIHISILGREFLYKNILSGFLASTFLLLLNLITLGRGMGLGDVKLALFAGFFLGYPLTILWLFLSFIIGGVVGMVLLLLGKAKFGRPIPFGPFLVVSFFVTWFWGEKLVRYLMPTF